MYVGILDIAAAGALALVILLPSPSRPIKPQYVREMAALGPRIAEAQARVARAPGDTAAAAELADLLVRARQTDWAIRAAARGAMSEAPDTWRAQVAISAVHADRLELPLAGEWAHKALATCDAAATGCGDDDRGRLGMYVVALDAARASGADPKLNAKGMNDAVEKAVPLIRFGKRR